VDCASVDASLEVAQSAPFAETVALDENIGFGRGCNLGVRIARAPVIALLNPDVALIDDSLATLAHVALRSERLLAPRILYPDGSRQDSVHPMPGSGADLARSLLPPSLLPGRLGVVMAPWRAQEPRRVGWGVGAALVARADTLRRLGPFDERIFMYGEDLDLGLRAAAAGIETWFWPFARVVHHRAHATAREFGGEPFETLARARHEVVARRLGDRAASRDDRAQALTFRSRAGLKRALGRPAERERRQLQALVEVRRSAV
jgi:GT2 family glycosyltransferase